MNAQQFHGNLTFAYYSFTNPYMSSPVSSVLAGRSSVNLPSSSMLGITGSVCRFGTHASASVWNNVSLQWQGLAIAKYDYELQRCLTPPSPHVKTAPILHTNFSARVPNSTFTGSAQQHTA
eukprot:4214657-Prymnesium_polylepis.1